MEQRGLLRRGLLLEYATLGWNGLGVIILVAAAVAAHSVALAGFGLDSLIEIFASVVVVRHLLGIHVGRERVALRLIGVAFVLLVVYIAAQLTYTILARSHPEPSIGSIVWTALTFIAMLLLASGKHVTGRRLQNQVLQTEARVTLIDAYLAGAVLLGLALNALFRWWWADPLASLVIVYYAVGEARHAFQVSGAG